MPRLSKAPGHLTVHLPNSLSIAWLLIYSLYFYLKCTIFLYIPKVTKISLCLWLQIFTSRQPAFPANKLTDHQHTKAHGSILTTCRRAERLAPLLCLPLCNHWRWTAAPDVRWNQCNGYLNRWEEEQSLSLLLLSSHEEILLKAEWTKEFIYL